jgi:hypothetical protein
MQFLCHVIGLSFSDEEITSLGLEYTVYRAHPDYRRPRRGLRLCTFYEAQVRCSGVLGTAIWNPSPCLLLRPSS